MVITLASRFRGPARSGNGGYTAGLLATELDAPTVAVRLRQPPPLDTALDVVADGTGAQLRYGEEVVAAATPGELSRPAAGRVGYDEAVAASKGYRGFDEHPFPGCFTCGPDRAPGDGLRLFAGPVQGPAEGLVDGLVAAPWIPARAFADASGAVPAAILWAALDCPGGWSMDLIGRPMVLGRITATVSATPSVGEMCVVVGHAHGLDGRKGFTDSALYGEDGRLLACAEHTWIAVDPGVFNTLR